MAGIYFNIAGVGGIDAFTKLMLHGDESTLVDSSLSPHTLTPVNAARNATQSKFGGYSIYMDGDGDYITIGDNDDWTLGTGNYTVDTWVYFEDFTNTFQFISSQWHNTSKGHQFFYEKGLNRLHFQVGNGGTSGSSNNYTTWNASAGQWYHIAVVRNGNDLLFFIDGTQQGSTIDITGQNAGNSTQPFYLGCYVATAIDPNSYYKGYIDEYRWSKGIARWTSNFTPESGPYTE